MAESTETRETVRYLGRPVALLIVTLILAVTVVLLAAAYLEGLRITHAAVQAELVEVRREIQITQVNQRWMNEFSDAFQQLSASGMVGPEHRLDWVELINRQAEQIGLTSLDYEFKPRESMHRPGLGASSFDVYQSAMNVKMELLHDLDLTRMLTPLESGQKALVMPEFCTVKRNREMPVLEAQPTLEATCRLWWITIDAKAPRPAGDEDA